MDSDTVLALSPEAREVAANLATVYIDQARAVSNFLNLSPLPTLEESAATWVITRAMEQEVRDLGENSELQQHFSELARENIGAAFGMIMEQIEILRPAKTPSFEKLKESGLRSLEMASSERVTALTEAGGALAIGAGKLALGTLDLAFQCVSDKQKLQAYNLVQSLVDVRSTLNSLERHIAREWIDQASGAKH